MGWGHSNQAMKAWHHCSKFLQKFLQRFAAIPGQGIASAHRRPAGIPPNPGAKKFASVRGLSKTEVSAPPLIESRVVQQRCPVLRAVPSHPACRHYPPQRRFGRLRLTRIQGGVRFAPTDLAFCGGRAILLSSNAGSTSTRANASNARKYDHSSLLLADRCDSWDQSVNWTRSGPPNAATRSATDIPVGFSTLGSKSPYTRLVPDLST